MRPGSGRSYRALAPSSPPEVAGVGRSLGTAAASVLGARLAHWDGLRLASLVAPPHPPEPEPGPERALGLIPSTPCTRARDHPNMKGY